MPAESELFARNRGHRQNEPIAFTDGNRPSGLTYTFSSLASNTDDLSFSNNGGTSFGYTPVANASGVDPTVTHIRINPKGTFNSSGSFQILFRVHIK